jgi:PTH1 family peptidyl-tRNA hydrolase
VAQAIIGLGNPGPEYRDTRHNVGQRVVDGLARRIHTRFAREASHLVAQTRWHGDALYLIKLGSYMNVSGPAAARLCRKLHLGPADLIVVFDDLDLPLGKVRMRMTGSAGGHNGVHSLIESLGTRDFRRVKIGIGRPGAPGEKRAQVSDHVLSPFYPEEHEAIEAACAEAADLALELVERGTRVSPHCS